MRGFCFVCLFFISCTLCVVVFSCIFVYSYIQLLAASVFNKFSVSVSVDTLATALSTYARSLSFSAVSTDTMAMKLRRQYIALTNELLYVVC